MKFLTGSHTKLPLFFRYNGGGWLFYGWEELALGVVGCPFFLSCKGNQLSNKSSSISPLNFKKEYCMFDALGEPAPTPLLVW